MNKRGGIAPIQLKGYYNLSGSTVRKVLNYRVLERVRDIRIGRPRSCLEKAEVNIVI